MIKLNVFDIVLIALFAALLVVTQVGLSFLPNIEVVSMLIMMYTLLLKRKTIYIICIFVVAEGVIYGFGTWWFCYTYVWLILSLVTYLFRKNDSPVVWAMIAGVFGLTFGVLCSAVYLFVLGFEGMLAWIASGLLFDVIHGVSNFIIVLVVFNPLKRAVSKTLDRFGYTA